jgi:hypothetical protein
MSEAESRSKGIGNNQKEPQMRFSKIITYTIRIVNVSANRKPTPIAFKEKKQTEILILGVHNSLWGFLKIVCPF